MALSAIVRDMLVADDVCVEVECQQSDIELLFVDWLDAIIFEMATRKMLFGRFAVHIEGLTLAGKIWREPVDVACHAPASEPKGATLTELKVSRDADGFWSARCVVDV